MHLEEIKREILRIAALRGWSSDISNKLVNALTELGEAADAWKKGYPQYLKAEEISDLIISALDLSLAMCPEANMDKVVTEKLKLLENPKEFRNNYVIVDVSAFLYEKRLVFLLKLLEEEALFPRRVVLANEIYNLFKILLRGEEYSYDEAQGRLREIAGAWEGYYRHFPRIAEWFKSEKFISLLRSFFEKWQPIPAGELIGYSRERNPFNSNELKRKLGKAGELLYDELETAQRTRSIIICLSRALRRLLIKTRQVLVELPHEKKKKWMRKHKYGAFLAFAYVTDLVQRNFTTGGFDSFLQSIIDNASPFAKQLFVEVDIPMLRSIFEQLTLPAFDIALGLAAVVILYDSVDEAKIVLGQ